MEYRNVINEHKKTVKFVAYTVNDPSGSLYRIYRDYYKIKKIKMLQISNYIV